MQDENCVWTPDESWLAQIQSFAKLLQYGASTRLGPDAPATAPLPGYSDFCGSKLQAAVVSKNMTYLQTILYELRRRSQHIDCCFQMQKHDTRSFLSPLGTACLMGWSEGVLMLLEAGARQLPDDRKQMTPLMLAAARDHDHIIRILLSPRFLSSMLPREDNELVKHGDAAAGFARLRPHKSTCGSRLEGESPRGSLALRYCPALLNILEAKSSNDRRAVDWAGLHDKQSNCAVYLRKIHGEAASIMHSVNAQQLAPRCSVASEPVILQRSFLSWAYMQFFAAKHFEAMATRPASAQLACLSEGCSCSAMFCIPGLCFCLKGDLNSRNAADLGCLRDDGMNLDLNFSDPFVGDQCETVVRSVLENGYSPNIFKEFEYQMYNIPPDHDTDCNWLSIGTKLAQRHSASSSTAASNGVEGLSLINMIGTALVLQLLPRLLSLKAQIPPSPYSVGFPFIGSM